MTRKERFAEEAQNSEACKVVLGIRMPDGTKELIINDNVPNKVKYVIERYDDDLAMREAGIFIEEYMFVKK